MSNLVKIIDFGNSEYRLGYGGDTAPIYHQTPSKEKNFKEFKEFINKNKAPSFNDSSINVIFIEKNLKNQKIRKDMIQLIFEEEKFNSLFIAKSSCMGLYSVGKSSGVVLEYSESALDVTNVEDSFVDEKNVVISEEAPLKLFDKIHS